MAISLLYRGQPAAPGRESVAPNRSSGGDGDANRTRVDDRDLASHPHRPRGDGHPGPGRGAPEEGLVSGCRRFAVGGRPALREPDRQSPDRQRVCRPALPGAEEDNPQPRAEEAWLCRHRDLGGHAPRPERLPEPVQAPRPAGGRRGLSSDAPRVGEARYHRHRRQRHRALREPRDGD